MPATTPLVNAQRMLAGMVVSCSRSCFSASANCAFADSPDVPESRPRSWRIRPWPAALPCPTPAASRRSSVSPSAFRISSSKRGHLFAPCFLELQLQRVVFLLRRRRLELLGVFGDDVVRRLERDFLFVDGDFQFLERLLAFALEFLLARPWPVGSSTVAEPRSSCSCNSRMKRRRRWISRMRMAGLDMMPPVSCQLSVVRCQLLISFTTDN